MDVTIVNLIIIVLTVSILIGIVWSLSSRAYKRSAALTAAFLVLHVCGAVYRSEFAPTGYNAPAPMYSGRER
jgi:hypothetical protein